MSNESTEFPVTVAKGEQTRVAGTQADLVQLRFDGFLPVDQASAAVDSEDDSEDEPSDEELEALTAPDSEDPAPDDYSLYRA